VASALATEPLLWPPLANFLRNGILHQQMDSQLIQYLPVLMFLLVASGFAGSTLILSVVLGKVGRRTKTKDIPYECGMLPQGDGSARMSVKFYLVALLFVLFDIEVVFMYPWAVVYRDLLRENASMILGGMVSFLSVLFAGYLYALKKGALDWVK
jgi:NADH-quinone oxidoreductase subunit A